MMEPYGPCGPTSSAVHVIIVVLNVVQSVCIAWLSQRAVMKDRGDARRRKRANEEP